MAYPTMMNESDKIFVDENKFCRIDFSSALWVRTDLAKILGEVGLDNFLPSVDVVVETEQMLLFVEYKNSSVPNAAKPNPSFSTGEKLNQVARKYYGSLPYARFKQQGTGKRKVYVFLLEASDGDKGLREVIRERLKGKLPFELQERENFVESMIDDVLVIDIMEWRSQFQQFPIELAYEARE